MTDDLERARPADRDQAIAVVEAAYASGRIVEHDRAFRVEQIRTAGLRGEVQAVVRDLPPLPPAQQPTQLPRPAMTTSSTMPQARPPRRSGGKGRVLVVAGIVGLFLLGTVTTIATSLTGETQDAQPTTEFAPAPDRRDLLTKRGYAELVDAVEEKTGRRVAFQLVMYPDRATIAVPVDKRSRRQISYLWDGEWSDFGGKGTSTTDRFSLDDVDGALLRRIVVKARKQVTDATTWYVVVRPATSAGDKGTITAIASNDFNETASVPVELGATFEKQ